MILGQIPPGSNVFLDANCLVYHFTNDPLYASACTQLVQSIELGDLSGFVSSHVLADVAHRVMTLEAMVAKGWPATGIAARLRKNHKEISNLNLAEQSIAKLPQLRIQVIPVTYPLLLAATVISKQLELLTGDAVIVAVMQQHGFTNLASNDADFDRVPGITRFAAA